MDITIITKIIMESPIIKHSDLENCSKTKKKDIKKSNN